MGDRSPTGTKPAYENTNSENSVYFGTEMAMFGPFQSMSLQIDHFTTTFLKNRTCALSTGTTGTCGQGWARVAKAEGQKCGQFSC